MAYKNITWSEQDSLDYKRLDQMALNDEEAKMLAIRNPKGILYFSNYTTSSIQITSASHAVTQVMNGGNEPSVFIDKGRLTSLNFFAGRLVNPTPSMVYGAATGYPEPLFGLQYALAGATVWTDFNDFNWMIPPNGGISVGGGLTTQVGGAVSFSYVTQLPSGDYRFRVTATAQNSSTQFYIYAGSGDPVQFWVEDLGAISYV